MNELLDAMRIIGRDQALKLKENAKTMTGTDLIDREIFVPEWKPKKYQTVGEPVREGEQVYKVLQAHDSTSNSTWTPSTQKALFEIMHTKDPKKAKLYVAPFGTSGLYQKGEVCLWTDGKVYRSKVDNNAYSPGAYAQNWELV